MPNWRAGVQGPQRMSRTFAARKLQSRWRRYRTRRSLTNKIKKVSLGLSETKSVSQYVNSVDMYHNQTHYVTNLLQSYQHLSAEPGMSSLYNRIGNEVVARGIKIKLQLITSPQRPNQNARVIIFRYETNQAPNDGNFWCGPYGAGSSMNRMLDDPDTRNVKVLRSLLVQNQNTLMDTTNNSVHNVYRDIWIPLKNHKIKYESNNSSLPKYTTIGMAVVCYDANNTSSTDIVQYLGYSAKFYFKDP